MTHERVPFVDLAAEHTSHGGAIEAAIAKAIRANHWILGEDVALFEEEFAAYCGTRYAIGTDSGLSALFLSLLALHVGPGDEVIAPANTFIATILAILHAGATPVLVDVDPTTYQLDPELAAAALTEHTKAIVPVHLYGHPADMAAIMHVAEHAGVPVLEDACQAHGARLAGRRVGSFGAAAAFSFYPSKNLGAYGDGGIVVTNDDELADAVRMLRNYGQSRKYEHVIAGYNHRLDTLQAAILRVKLRGLDERNDARRRCAETYAELLGDQPLVLPKSADDVEHVWHLYVVQANRRDELRDHLDTCGIETGIHYPIPVHLQEACSGLGYRAGDFPVTEAAADTMLSLPMYPQLPKQAIERVADAIAAFEQSSARDAVSGDLAVALS